MNGYYITEGKLFDERSDPNYMWYSFIAYKFLENGTFLKAIKFSRDKNSVDFTKSDFKKENTGSYEFKNGQLVFHLNKGKPWEEKEYLEKTGYGEFMMKSGQKIKFKPW